MIAALEAHGQRVTTRRWGDAMAQCPAHDDGRPSLHVTYKPHGATDGSGMTALKCFAACQVEDICAPLSLGLADLFDVPMKRETGKAARASSTPRRRQTKTAVRKPAPQKPPRDLGAPLGPAEQTDAYVYTDADGVVLGRVLRIESRFERGVEKTFRQQHPSPSDPARWVPGGWDDTGLYLLPDVAAAKADGRLILVAEGEKDVHTAADLWGVTATTNRGGGGSWSATCTEQLAGAADVLVVLDRDATGYLRGLTLHHELTGRVSRLRLALPVEGKDLTDHAQAKGLGDLQVVTPAEVLTALVDDGSAQAAGFAAGWLLALPGDVELAARLGSTWTETAQRLVDRLSAEDRDIQAADVAALIKAHSVGVGDTQVADQAAAVGVGLEDVVRKDVYAIHKGMIVKRSRSQSKNAPVLWDVVMDAVARIERVTYADDGITSLDEVGADEAPATRYVVVRWSAEVDGETVDLGRQTVPADKWSKGDWIAEGPAVGTATQLPAQSGDRAAAVKAISAVSGRVPREAVYTCTGWRQDTDGSWFYVHAGDGGGNGRAITATGDRPVRTDFDGEAAANIRFPAPPTTAQQWAAGVAELADMLDQIPERITAPGLGCVFRAALDWTQPTLHFSGEKESGKSSIATLLVSMYDPAVPFSAPRVSMAAGSASALAARRTLAPVVHALALLDDANPDQGVKVAAEKLSFNVRCQAERLTRTISKRDGSGTISGRPVRGTQMTTAELNPSDAGLNSADSRLFTVRVVNGDLDTTGALPKLHRKPRRERRSTLMAGLISWMAARLPELRAQHTALVDRENAVPDSYIGAFDKLFGARLAVPLAEWAFGWHLMLGCLRDNGALTAVEAEKWFDRVWQALIEAGHAAQTSARSADYAEQLRQYLSTSLSTAEAHLISRNPDGPEIGSELRVACGWKEDLRASYSSLGDVTKYAPGGSRIGFVDEDERRAYIIPEAALGAAATVARRSGTSWDATVAIVGGALRKGNRCRPHVEGTVTRSERRLRIGGSRLSVWDIDLDWLLGLDEDENGAAGHPILQPTPLGPDSNAGQVIPLPRSEHVAEHQDEDEQAAAERLPAAVGEDVDERPVAMRPLRHPVEVMEPQFHRVNRPTCVTCGTPADASFAGIALHIGCEAPAWLVVTDTGIVDQRPAAVTQDGRVPFVELPAATPVAPVVDEQVATVADEQPAPGDTPEAAPSLHWAAVADVDGLHLADGAVIALPTPLNHAGQLAALALDVLTDFCVDDRHWQPERAQVWMTPALVETVGLPAALPDPGNRRAWKTLAVHGWWSGAVAAGWQLGQKPDGTMPDPTLMRTIWMPKGRGITLAIPSWGVGGGGRIHQVDDTDAPTPAQLAARLEKFAELTGLPYRWTPAVTGLTRMKHLHRDPRATPIRRVVAMPEPFVSVRSGEREVIWHRELTGAEAAMPQLVAFDRTAAYAAAMNSLPLGLDVDPQHLTGDVQFSKKRPGIWRVSGARDLALPGGELVPPTDRLWRIEPDDSAWLTTPMLDLLASWGVAVTITEAWVWDRGSRVLDSFYGVARSALAQLPREDEDPQVKALRRVVKASYTDAIGRLGRNLRGGEQPDAWWRPDWRKLIIGSALARMLRTVEKVGSTTGRWPVLMRVDQLVYACPEGDPAVLAPEGLDVGPGLGRFHADGAVPITPAVVEAFAGRHRPPVDEWIEGR